MAGGLVHLWEESGIQILVLLSFTYQIFLLAFAGIRRRRKAPALMRLLIWLVYLLADSTAIYALGHLSLMKRSREHRLMAFWAPFLLVQLGGPDSITAYALEDSRLWLRHLLTLLVQVVGVAYVILRYTADSGTLVLIASILMFMESVADTYSRYRVYNGVVFGDHAGVRIGPISWGMVKKLFQKDGPNDNFNSGRIQEMEKFTKAMLSTFSHDVERNIKPPDCITNPTHSYREYGSPLANEPHQMESGTPNLLQAMLEVWLEMLCYAANRCSGDSHARQLSSGGEFITVVWLLTRQIRDRTHRIGTLCDAVTS